MIHVLTGTNENEKLTFLKKHKEEKYPNILFEVFDDAHFDCARIEEVVSGNSLFGDSSSGVIIHNALSNQEKRELVARIVEKSTDVAVYLVVDALDKESAELLVGTDIHTFAKVENKPDFTLFGAVYARDKKAVWKNFCERVTTEPVDLLHGSILSQVKNMYKVTHIEGTYKDLGFTAEGGYQKALQGAKKYSKKEIASMYGELVAMPSSARSKGFALELALEKFLLERL